MSYASLLFAGGAVAVCGLLRWRKRMALAVRGPRQSPRRGAREGSYVVIRDPSSFETKRRRILAGGADRCFIVTDFDYTMTKFWAPDGESRLATTHKVLEDCDLFGPEYHESARALQLKYYPLEVSPTVSEADKERYMLEWVTQAHDLLVRTGLRRDQLAGVVRQARVELRQGVDDVLRAAYGADIPVLVFSAGVADVLEQVLLHRGLVTNNLTIVGNRMAFDAGGRLVGFEEPCFHGLNKKAKTIRHLPYFDLVATRPNALLLGDNMHDLGMAEGLPCEQLLTVGFLNDHVDERLDKYAAAFDVVVVNDGPMDVVNELLRELVTGGKGAKAGAAGDVALRPRAGAGGGGGGRR